MQLVKASGLGLTIQASGGGPLRTQHLPLSCRCIHQQCWPTKCCSQIFDVWQHMMGPVCVWGG